MHPFPTYTNICATTKQHTGRMQEGLQIRNEGQWIREGVTDRGAQGVPLRYEFIHGIYIVVPFVLSPLLLRTRGGGGGDSKEAYFERPKCK